MGVRGRDRDTQKQISYTFAPLRSNSSDNLSCFSVSMVFGCRPSALPVDVAVGRSSRRVTGVP